MVATRDLKSLGHCDRAGSSPASSTMHQRSRPAAAFFCKVSKNSYLCKSRDAQLVRPKSTTIIMTANAPYPDRKSPRADFHDYSGGDYFITICTRDKEHYFGHIRDNEMHYSIIGEFCKQQFEQISKHYPYAEIPLFVVMPNHVHAIVSIGSRTHEPCVPTERTALSVIIGGLKRAVTLFARRNNIEFGWQSRYHDHIIRGVNDGNKIANYIENNVARWANDCYNPSHPQ